MKRRRLDRDEARALILSATERVMKREGYGAVTIRRVAEEAGFKAPLVHYYFNTPDDLLLAFYRSWADGVHARLEDAIKSDQPLREIWNLNSDPERAGLSAEFIALANHKKSISHEIGQNVERLRALQVGAYSKISQDWSSNGDTPTAEVVALFISAVGRALVMEEAISVSSGHLATRSFIESLIAKVEAAPDQRC